MQDQPRNIWSELRQKIIDRSIPPGTKLSETSLSREWNVSRTPIREILRGLESEGLVTSRPYKGWYVNTVTIEDVDQLYTIRIQLEGLVGSLATPIIWTDPKKLEMLENLCKEMETFSKKGDIESYIKKNDQFHSYIWHSCGNRWLINVMDNLDSHIKRFMVRALHVPNRMKRSLHEHQEICEKLKLGNPKEVEKILRSHVRKASDDLKDGLVSRKTN